MEEAKTASLIKLPDLGKEIAIPEAWAAKRDRAIVAAKAIETVANPVAYDQGSEALNLITKCGTEIEKERKKFSAPFLEVQRAIKKMCDDNCVALGAEKTRLKKLLADYQIEQERKEREEKRARDEAERKEAERLFAAQQAEEDLGIDTAPEPITVPVAAPPVVQKARSSSSRVVKRLVWEEVDIDKIPRAFLMLDTRKVNEYMRGQDAAIKDGLDKGSDGTQYIAGIRFKVSTDISGR